jgi:hypothetical protein
MASNVATLVPARRWKLALRRSRAAENGLGVDGGSFALKEA